MTDPSDKKHGPFQMPYFQFQGEIYMRASDLVAFMETLEGVAIEYENMPAVKLLRTLKNDFNSTARMVDQGVSGVEQLRVIDIEEGMDDQART